jgi:methyl-accepting chemotaxis protein
MELCLAEFMSRFSERVGQAIDEAMSKKVDAVFNAIKVGSDSLATYSETMHKGVESLSESGKVFYQASKYFRDSSFPEDLGKSLNAFIVKADSLSESASLLSSNLSDISVSKESMMDDWRRAQDLIATSSQNASRVLEVTNEYTRLMVLALEEIQESSKQLRAARLVIGKENKTSDELTRSLIYELETGRSERDSLTNAVQTLIDQLEQRTISDSRLAALIDSNLSVQGLSPDERRGLAALLDQLTKLNPENR